MITITGKLESAAGETLHGVLTFTSKSTPQFPPTIVQTNTVKRILSNASTGEFSVTLAAGLYLVNIRAAALNTTFYISVPDGTDTVSIETLVSSTTAALPGVAPYTVWNGERAGHLTFNPVSEPSAPTTEAITVEGGHQTFLDLFGYVIVWETTEGYTIGSPEVMNTPPSDPLNATRITLPTAPSRVIATHIHRSTDDATTNRYLLATVAPNVTTYDDWESTADFNARLNATQTVPLYNTTAGIIYSAVGTPELYFSYTGLRALAAMQFDAAATFLAGVKIATGAAAGYVLTSDADGNASWQAAGSSGQLSGTGSPEGIKTASPGATYFDTAAESLWCKKTGTGNTGWVQLLK